MEELRKAIADLQKSCRDLRLDEEEEHAERQASRRRKRLGIKKPTKTNFPRKGDDKAISLSNSEFSRSSLDKALKLKRDQPHLWKMAGPKSKSHFLLWEKAEKGDDSPAVQRWIKRRESYARANHKKFSLRSLIALTKWGIVSKRGATAHNAVVRAGITGDDTRFKLKRSSGEGSEA